MKFLKVNIYGDVVVDADLPTALSFFEKLISVETEGYGRELRAFEKDNELSFDLIDEKQFVRRTDEKETAEHLMKKLAETKKQLDESNSVKWDTQTKLKELQKELEVLKEVCPHKNNEEEV